MLAQASSITQLLLVALITYSFCGEKTDMSTGFTLYIKKNLNACRAQELRPVGPKVELKF